MIPKEESQQVEFKLIWKDEYLKQLCGFANSQGGSMYFGVNDHGKVVGLQNTKRLLEEIPNKGANLMGIVLHVDLLFENSLPYLLLKVPQSSQPVSLRGKYYVRSGSTTQELNGFALQNFLLKRLLPLTPCDFFLPCL
ncbi:MAG: ATP-binding protein [Bacteroidales bacterium]|nr:ATP-binding protein [Bacteroidales bacterium]